MNDPFVICVMLTKDRPAMARRALECFRSQTYENKYLMIMDTGIVGTTFSPYTDNEIHWVQPDVKMTIGALRNCANKYAAAAWQKASLFAHFDDDDWSHPNRIAEQVELISQTQKHCVGYRDMLFWRLLSGSINGHSSIEGGTLRDALESPEEHGEAWFYRNDDPRYCLGTSMLYWKSEWERRPFPKLQRGEDKAWIRGVDSLGVSSLGPSGDDYPRLIASIHGGNSSTPDPKGLASFTRVAEWDEHCRKLMTL